MVPRERSALLLALGVLMFIIVDCLPAHAVVTTAGSYWRQPQVWRPRYRASYTDSLMGSLVTRVGGDSGVSLPNGLGVWGADSRHVYSKQQPWNADQSLYIMENRSGSVSSKLLLDGTSFLPKYAIVSSDSLYDYRWHPDSANILVNVTSTGTNLTWLDVSTYATLGHGTVTRTYHLPFKSDGFGGGEGNLSADGRWVALSNTADTKACIVDMALGRVGAALTLPLCGLVISNPSYLCPIGHVSISPSGKYVEVKYGSMVDSLGGSSLVNQDAIRVFSVDTTALTITPQTNATVSNSARCHLCYMTASRAAQTDSTAGWVQPLKHPDMALDPYDNNEDVLVGGRSCTIGPIGLTGRVLKVRMKDGLTTVLTDSTLFGSTSEASIRHVSTRNARRPQWAYADYYGSPALPGSGTVQRYQDEVVAVNLSGDRDPVTGYRRVERYTHMHSFTTNCYRCESHPVASWDGQRIVFASNWADSCGGGGCGDTSSTGIAGRDTSRLFIKDYLIKLSAITNVPKGTYRGAKSGNPVVILNASLKLDAGSTLVVWTRHIGQPSAEEAFDMMAWGSTQLTRRTTGQYASLWTADNVTGGNAALSLVTTGAAGIDTLLATVTELIGASKSSLESTNSTIVEAGGVSRLGPIATARAHEMLFAAFGSSGANATATWDSSFTAGQSVSYGTNTLEEGYRFTSSIGSYSVGKSVVGYGSSPFTYAGIMAVFKEFLASDSILLRPESGHGMHGRVVH